MYKNINEMINSCSTLTDKVTNEISDQGEFDFFYSNEISNEANDQQMLTSSCFSSSTNDAFKPATKQLIFNVNNMSKINLIKANQFKVNTISDLDSRKIIQFKKVNQKSFG